MSVTYIPGGSARVGAQADLRLVQVVELSFDCVQACTVAADRCLSEETEDNLRECLRLVVDCAGLCVAAGEMASRDCTRSASVMELLSACRQACLSAAAECERVAFGRPYCQACARACRACAEACRAVFIGWSH
jgi:Domain of Unknown Function (DUF326)